jgi:hypothetical protein
MFPSHAETEPKAFAALRAPDNLKGSLLPVEPAASEAFYHVLLF